jgi:DNA polymerase III epsilon subunit-like protein
VFVAFNAPFDWMFVNDYFHHYLGRNPFGHRALDIKAVFMGLSRQAWAETTYRHISAYYGQPEALAHNAETDARQAAELFAAILSDLKEKAQ